MGLIWLQMCRLASKQSKNIKNDEHDEGVMTKYL